MCLEHRSLLDHPPGFRPFLGAGLFERIGGDAAGVGVALAEAPDLLPGRTPLDWLEQAAPSVPRAAVRSLLARRR